MNETDLFELKQIRRFAQSQLDSIDYLAKRAEMLTGNQSGIVADYIWGNCTLERLQSVLDGTYVPTEAEHRAITQAERIEKLEKFINAFVDNFAPCPNCMSGEDENGDACEFCGGTNAAIISRDELLSELLPAAQILKGG